MGANAGRRFEKMTPKQLRLERDMLIAKINHAIDRREELTERNAPDSWIMRLSDEISEAMDELSMLEFYLGDNT